MKAAVIAALAASIAAPAASAEPAPASAERAARDYLDRIERLDPKLHSILALNPDSLVQARALDAERRAGKVRGPLHGLAIVVKDNIETADRLPTTAGSLALKDNLTGRDAPFVARLRAAGVIVLGKTNLSEWANYRGTRSSSGWSAVGGLTRNPYALDRSACGSSSGTGAAVAASLAAGGIGTETSGSIVCPASVNGLVGLKPTVGLVSRTHVIPITSKQDTAGPMTRTVADAAALLTVMAGTDPADPATAQADARKTDYVAALDAGALKGRRLGVLKFAMGFNRHVDALFAQAVEQLKAAGAEVVEIEAFDAAPLMKASGATSAEFKSELAAYLATTPPAVKVRTLADVIAFNRAHAAEEMPWFGQERMEQAEATPGAGDPEAVKTRAAVARAAGPEGVDRLLAEHRLDALIAPTTGPAWLIDLVNGDNSSGGLAGAVPAVAGYPHLTVPMGQVFGLPVGLSFIGPAWSEAKMLSLGYAFEQRTRARKPPTLAATLPLP